MAKLQKNVEITGGSPQLLSSILLANGYPANASMMLTEKCIRNTGANSVYLGGSSVDASTGYEIAAGDSDTERASGVGGDIIDATTEYLFVASTQNISLRVRGL